MTHCYCQPAENPPLGLLLFATQESRHTKLTQVTKTMLGGGVTFSPLHLQGCSALRKQAKPWTLYHSTTVSLKRPSPCEYQ